MRPQPPLQPGVMHGCTRPQEWSNLLSSLASLLQDLPPQSRLEPLLLHTMSSLAALTPHFNAQDVGNTMWALAKLSAGQLVLPGGQPHPGVLALSAGCVQAASRLLQPLQPQDVRAGQLPLQPPQPAPWLPQEVANTLWGLAVVRLYPRELVASLMIMLAACLPGCRIKAQELSITLWSLSVFEHTEAGGADVLADYMFEHAGAVVPLLGMQVCSNCLHGLVVLGMARHPVVPLLMRHASDRWMLQGGSGGAHVRELCQMYQVGGGWWVGAATLQVLEPHQ